MFKSLVLPTLMLLTLPALAQADPGNRGACRADVERLCPDAEGRQDARACLDENAEALSAECTASKEKRAEKHAARKAEVQAACGADIEQFCADAEGREVKRCLRENREALSEECQAVAKRGRKHKRGGGCEGKRGEG